MRRSSIRYLFQAKEFWISVLKGFLFLYIILFLLIYNAQAQYCSNNTRYTEVQFFDSTEITIANNIQYGTAPDHLGNAYPLRMDLYYPNLAVDTSAKRPFIMLFHGGGFSSGDKQAGDIKDLAIHLALRGFVCASVNYRIGYDFTEYGQYKARYRAIQDGHAALRYIVSNATTVRIDTSWLLVAGQSAGSLLALGMVYADQDELDSISLLYNATSTSVELGNLYTSGNNLTNTYTIKAIFNNWGGVNLTEVDRGEMIPTIAFHGELDTLVKIDADHTFLHYTLNGSRAIHQQLLANNICTELTVDTTGGHGIFRNSSSLFRAQRASCFFKSVFCNSCSNFYSIDSIATNCSEPLSLAQYSNNSVLIIYPNPFENSFKIGGLDSAATLSVYNSLGALVHQQEVKNAEVELALIPGIYFLHIIQAGNNRIYNTVVIKK